MRECDAAVLQCSVLFIGPSWQQDRKIGCHGNGCHANLSCIPTCIASSPVVRAFPSTYLHQTSYRVVPKLPLHS